MTDTVWFDRDRNRLCIIDQTLLPNEVKILSLHTAEAVEQAIRTLQVRGAPAIGVAAAIGLAVLAAEMRPFHEALLLTCAERLKRVRPTAVNLAWAINRMLAGAHDPESLAVQAQAIWAQDIATCRKIGVQGSALLRDGGAILTHCNAGRLAAVRYGTALAPVYVATEQGKRVRVFADETRPLLQGARLTAWELREAGVPVTLLCDNMAAGLLARGAVDAVFVGADRVARNGDAANKTGSLGLSILARHFGVPFYVCAPFSTYDAAITAGTAIPIEQRAGEELTALWYAKPMAPAGVDIYNPAFDVVPHKNITAFVTEHGVLAPDDLQRLSK
ncbi:MAG: S-methyl-5-thioribose-1-phosphate isomerase [Oscillospiraceae bacterium]|jgi:methylthioribose-1-phosphate isomerase|nr:S-methyl-5-thioribose-1-phosphate isomerase [Oscillospiraceae bacterium]